ncbi:MAG: PQQ-binding-like beta-propeller repeat protein [Gemmatales bacterium]
MSTPTPKPAKRRLIWPAIILAIPILLIALESLWDRMEWDPTIYMMVGMAMSFSVMLAPVVLLLWFLFFSGYARQTKLSGVLLLLVVIGAGFALIRKVEFSGKMRPIVYYRWEKLPQDDLSNLAIAANSKPLDISITAVDSPFYRGPRSDGTTPSAPADAGWVNSAVEKLWQHPLGGGHAGIAVAGQLAITIEQRGNEEAVVAYDAETGEPRWVHQYPASFQHSEPMGGNGPRTTPTIVESHVYTLGAQGHLHCLELATGKVVWKENIIEDAGAKNLEWGMSGTPLVVDDLVIVNPGVNEAKTTQQAVIAYDRKTGKKRWAAGSDMAGYASPMLAKLAGVEQILLFDAAGLKGLDLKDGKQLWQYPWKTSFEMNCAQPIVCGEDQVFISSEVANGGAMLQVQRQADAWTVKQVWHSRYFGIKFSNVVLHQGHLYGLANGYLACFDARTGDRKWKARQNYGNGQVLLAGNVLVITTEAGEVALVAADAAAFKELKKVPVFTGRTWNVPAIAKGRLYLRNHQEVACVKLW